MSSYATLSAYFLGSQKDTRFCRDLVKAEKLNLDEIKLETDLKIDPVGHIANLEVIAEEQKHSGAKESILELLSKLGEDPRKEVEAFDGVLDIAIGKMLSKIPIENAFGEVSYRKCEGTAFIVYQLSRLAVVLQTVVHNLYYFSKSPGADEAEVKQAEEAFFLHQNIGKQCHLLFKVIKFLPMVNQMKTQTITDGSDYCYAIGIVDTSHPSYSPEKMENLKLFELVELPVKEKETFAAFIIGYPAEVFNGQTLRMEPNHQLIPYVSGGGMHYELRNEGDSGTLLYKEAAIFSSKGQSGAIIIGEKDGYRFIAGHHAGTLDGGSYGPVHITEAKIDYLVPMIKNNLPIYNEAPADLAKYRAPFDAFCE